MLVERCFHALDTRKIRFRDAERRCLVASTDAATVSTLVGICLLTQPEIVVGAVIIVGVVVVAVAIQEELDAYELRRQYPEEEITREPVPETIPIAHAPLEKRGPRSEPSGQDWFPPGTPEFPDREHGPECIPKRVPPKGGNSLHNMCADNVPLNAFRGANVLVNGKAFDALQPATRTLWEVKTTAIETYKRFVQQIELEKQVAEGRRERDLAAACGYRFVIGVRTEEHKAMLERLAPDLTIVLMPWC
ncbi:DUF6310 domain-containing protein [Corallococcus terminator]|uniref:DUF6310 domain-containing protein n=1 Tax=Corallococcus terminator TaxID=2316733 RepID=UPI0031343481